MSRTGSVPGEGATLDRPAPAPADTRRLGRVFGRSSPDGAVLLVEGDLGAGKTTFAQGVAEGCGVAGPVSSPTYNLVLHHPGRRPFVHADFYRLAGPEELESRGSRDLPAHRTEGTGRGQTVAQRRQSARRGADVVGGDDAAIGSRVDGGGASSCSEEAFEPPLEALSIRTISPPRRRFNRVAMHLLQPMQQHGAVDLVQQPLVDAYLAVARDAKQVTVIGSVVDLAKAEPIWNDGLSVVMSITNDVGGVQ